MAERTQILVVGLGRFGSAVATTLVELGVEVLGIDGDTAEVARASAVLTQALELDATDLEALRQIGAADFDKAVVAIGSDVEASILATSNLAELEVKEIIAKAMTASHARILQRVGAHRVIFPEWEMGVRVANSLAGTNLIDFMELGAGFEVAEVRPPRPVVGMTLREADLRKRFGCIVLCIRSGEEVVPVPDADRVIGADDVLVVAGEHGAVTAFAASRR